MAIFLNGGANPRNVYFVQNGNSTSLNSVSFKRASSSTKTLVWERYPGSSDSHDEILTNTIRVIRDDVKVWINNIEYSSRLPNHPSIDGVVYDVYDYDCYINFEATLSLGQIGLTSPSTPYAVGSFGIDDSEWENLPWNSRIYSLLLNDPKPGIELGLYKYTTSGGMIVIGDKDRNVLYEIQRTKSSADYYFFRLGLLRLVIDSYRPNSSETISDYRVIMNDSASSIHFGCNAELQLIRPSGT